MPRLNIIVLDQPDVHGNPFQWRVAFWADVPLARQSFYAKPAAVSAWAGATGTDNTNLQNGSVVETVIIENTGNRVVTNPIIQGDLQAKWQDFQNKINNDNPWGRYGSTWDGTTWTVTGIP